MKQQMGLSKSLSENTANGQERVEYLAYLLLYFKYQVSRSLMQLRKYGLWSGI